VRYKKLSAPFRSASSLSQETKQKRTIMNTTFTTAKLSTLVLAITLASSSLFGQQTGSVWVKIPSAQDLSIGTVGGRLMTSSSKVNTLISTYTIHSIEKAFPASRTAALQDVYELNCSCDEQDLLQAVAREHDVFVSPEIGPHYEVLFTPNDYFLSVQNDYALNLIKAQEAWNYTTGSSSVVIAITDSNFDPQHEELQGKYTYMTQGLTGTSIAHGTAVAITAGGATNNSVGKSSVGYNSQLQLRGMNYNEILAASYSGAKIINASWASSCTFSQYAQDVITEVYNNGSLVIASAGNGTTCGGASNLVYPASYEHVLSVSSVGPQDNHERFPGNPSITHQHNSQVDICAPGYDVSISSTSGSYVTGTGSSYAAAYVSGTAALILSINPCLSPADLTYILKTSADNIDALNANYFGTIGTGRLNTTSAIQLALSFSTLEIGAIVRKGCETTDQAIQLEAVSGVAPFTAVWSNGSTGMEMITNVPGVYTYAVTDANGCVTSGSVTLEQVTLLSYTSTVENVLCNGDSNGSIDLTVNGGTAPYSYEWESGEVTEDLSGLSAGAYRVDVTDAGGCTFAATFEITAPSALTLAVSSVNPTYQTNGTVDLTVNGGTGSYNYLWSNGSVTEDLTGVGAGIFAVTVTDANGCQATETVTLHFESAVDTDNNTQVGVTDADGSPALAAGVEESTSAMAVRVYPNPATDYVTVNLSIDGEATLTLSDLNGKIISTGVYTAGMVQLDVQDLSNGTYLVQVTTAGGAAQTHRMIKR